MTTPLRISLEGSALNIKSYGAKVDGQRIRNVTASTSSPSVTVPQANFTAADAGKACVVYTDTAAGTITTIQSVISPTQVTLAAANAGIAVSGSTGYFLYGTDDSAAISAAFTDAAARINADTTVGANQPQTGGKPTVLVPSSQPGSWCVIASAITVPSGVRLDCEAKLVNLLADRYAPAVIFSPDAAFGKLAVELVFGAGVQLGTDPTTQAHIFGGEIELWHTGKGTETAGLLRSQDAVAMLGYSFGIDTIWVKGGVRGVYQNPGSDFTCGRTAIIGALTGVQMLKTNQCTHKDISLDSCGQTGGGTSGIVLDNGCSDITFDAKAFCVTGLTRSLDNVVLLGNGSPNKNVDIRFSVSAEKTGGTVVNFAAAQDIECTVLASNTASNSSGGNNITNAVVYGSGAVAGACRVSLAMSGSVTPYSGTVAGILAFARSGVWYTLQGGVSAPTSAAQPANGTTPPAPSVTGNDQRGKVSFGSGSAPAAGAQVTVAFQAAGIWPTAPIIHFTPTNAATAAALPYVTSISATGFTIAFVNAPAASQAAGTFGVHYRVDG